MRCEDWKIDTSCGRDILVYKDCSVIEGEDAWNVLDIIRSFLHQAAGVKPVPVALEDLRRSFEVVARLNNEMYRWASCMSYNGSYVGEPEGLLKRNIREIERILDRCKNDKGE
ncbi:hypothetical protein OHR01_000904 [Salmonella enterica]|nr:hypothetical protein [Salmonella enterica]EKG3678518.1 hypothetical protein [Salmonella enterica]